ncbi:NUDIX hydrolase [Myxococcus sp. CA056]|uniref:NUDIX hydrolase n=1 Tax=Myxococcus sp. CA056 TaxID=2741740 RepID=UPI00157A47B8|nr:NUDIX hydrolase [Myxococcus sp. CA056]NTX09166.1 NUDIX hydrolase [Myxococcus sp. CA056]
MSGGRVWQGNWRVRLYARVRERGYDSLTAFADARPAVSLMGLADELGKGEVAGLQILSVLRSEAESCEQVTRFVRDALVRKMAEYLPNGWPEVMDDESRFVVAKLLTFWSTDIPETHRKRVENARVSLRTSPPPSGWRPLGPDDALLCALLPDDEARG